MSAESPKSSKIDIVKDAAKRAIALTEIAGVAIAGVATMDALADPGTAHAGTEAAMTHEGQSPQAFINTFNRNFAAIAHEMPSSHHFKSVPQPKLSKIMGKKVKLWFVSVPSREHAGKYDVLDVAMVGDQPVPDSATLYTGADNSVYQKVKSWDQVYNVSTTAGPGLGNWLSIDVRNGSSTPIEDEDFYYVSSTGNYADVTTDAHHTTFKQNPNSVSTVYNDLLSKMRAMISQK